MITEIKKFIKKHDHTILLVGLIFFIGNPLWNELIPGKILIDDIAILLIIISGLSVIFYQGERQFRIPTYFGLFVILLTFIEALFKLSGGFLTIVRYSHVGFFLLLTMILLSINIKAKSVTAEVVINSVSGYLLLGLSWAILVVLFASSHPGSFTEPIGEVNSIYDGLYFSIVTLTTLGYGDYLPLTPAAKSLSIFITVTGAFYTTILMGLIVGKFISTQNNNMKS